MISRDTVANVTSPRTATHEGIAGTLLSARGFALLCAGLYLAISGGILAIDDQSMLVGAHIGAICVLLWAALSRRATARLIGDFAPLLLMPLLYAELPRLMPAFGGVYHDGTIQRWELWLFGDEPSRTLAGRFPFVVLSELLHFGYLAYYPAVFVPSLLLYANGDRRGFAQNILALTVTYAVCWMIFAVYPVEGPRYEWAAPVGVPDGLVRRIALAILAGGSSRGAAFPSSHMAISTVQVLIVARWHRALATLLAVVACLVGIGAVYGGFHYGIDVVAGAALGTLVAAAVLIGTRGHRRADSRGNSLTSLPA
jgi:membrane-associated phospholipid phosphatase